MWSQNNNYFYKKSQISLTDPAGAKRVNMRHIYVRSTINNYYKFYLDVGNDALFSQLQSHNVHPFFQ